MNNPRQPKGISVGQIVCIAFLWLLLVVMVFMYAELNFFTLFSVFASGVIVFVPLYKKWKRTKRNP